MIGRKKNLQEVIGTKIFQMMVDRQVKSSLLPFDVGEAVKSKTTKEAGLRVNSVIHTDNRI